MNSNRVTKVYQMLMVTDMTRSTSFYKNSLGLEPITENPNWTELKGPGGGIVALHPGRESTTPSETGLGFDVTALEDACAAIESAGGSIFRRPEDREGEPVRLAGAADPDGNRFWLAEPKPHR